MGWSLNLEIGLLEIADLVLTFVLALLVVKIGWRFTNVRAGKDLILEEGKKIIQVCDQIRKALRKIPYSEIPKFEDFTEYLDDLGNYLYNCKKMYTLLIHLNLRSLLNRHLAEIRSFSFFIVDIFGSNPDYFG